MEDKPLFDGYFVVPTDSVRIDIYQCFLLGRSSAPFVLRTRRTPSHLLPAGRLLPQLLSAGRSGPGCRGERTHRGYSRLLLDATRRWLGRTSRARIAAGSGSRQRRLRLSRRGPAGVFRASPTTASGTMPGGSRSFTIRRFGRSGQTWPPRACKSRSGGWRISETTSPPATRVRP